MRKKLKMFIFSKMASTILIKFWGLIVHSKRNNMTLSAFPKKSLKLEKLFLIVNPLPSIAPKPTGRSRSHSIPRVPLQISLAHFFRFRSILKIKGSSHKNKKLNFHFLKNGSHDLHQILWVYCTFEHQEYGTIGFSRKNLRN